MTKWIVGNWKMYGEPQMARSLAQAVVQAAARAPQQVQVVLCPPALLVCQLVQAVQGSPVGVGGQDCHTQPEGAFTGNISAPMLKEAGAGYVIVGHSERRALHGESSEQVRQKAAQAISAGLVPIICVGETLAERDSGKALEVVAQQVLASLPENAKAGNFVLAYEPVWAIGSGKTPSTQDIVQMHAHIIGVVAAQQEKGSAPVAVLYGGSVKPENAADILSQGEVSGVLVGGASLRAEQFCSIIEAA